ncbi:MAG: YitT family protein [Clostridiales bacterium]|nr:YitT family protein [Clostridiales bacterium]
MSIRRIKNKKLLAIKKYLIIIIGSFLMALAINLIYEPLGLVTGGLTGLAIVVKELTGFIREGGIPVWLFTVICNIPLFVVAIKILGFRTMINVALGTISLIIALFIIPIVDFQFEDLLLASVVGGTLTGVGLGMVFSASSSTGGTDLLASIIHKFKRYLSVPHILIFIDGAIVILGALVFGLGNALYAIISIYLSSKVSDGILEGLKFAKMAYIISDEYEKIASEIMTNLDRGVTGLNSTGMYSNKDRKMLFCVVSKKEIVKITEIAKKIDPNSFIIVNDVREVMGEGFIEY